MATPRDIKRPPAEVFNRFKVFRYLASTLSRTKQHQASLPFYKLAEEFARGPNQECGLLTERARVYWTMGEIGLARQDVDKALSLCPDALDSKFTNAKLLFAEDKIEDSLIVSHLGLRQRKMFAKNVRATSGTIENTVGRNAGPMMRLNNLGKTIVKMKKKDLGQDHERKLSPQEQINEDRLFEKQLRCYTEKFLGMNANDKYFFMDCLSSRHLFASKGLESEELIKSIMKDSLDRIHKKQMSLWIRRPLYTQDNANARISKAMVKEAKEAGAIKMAVLNNEAVRQLEDVTAQLEKGDLVETYRKAMHLWQFLMSKPETLLPNKKVLCDCVYEILGAMYLNSKKLQKNMTEKQNDARIYFLLGIYKPYTVAIEVFKGGLHADIFDYKLFIGDMTEHMRKSTSPLETAMISHELSCAYSMQQYHEKARYYSRICSYEAKKAENLTWYFNGLFLLTRSELQEANLTEAKITLTAARDLAQLFSLKDTYDFITRSIEVISRETESSLRGGASLAKREKQLLDLMATADLRSQIHKQLEYIRSLPVNLRLSLLPGFKPKKEAKSSGQGEISLEAQLREEQNVQYLISQRFTLQPPELAPDFLERSPEHSFLRLV